ncbi:MAG: hypothetical protein JF590_00895 [Gemmatimonadetes bacterium]|nr:hypothetical protein [Gemmatimonadota bacterium]
MADQGRDWDKEMAAIDQVIAKGGYVAPSGGAPAAAPASGGAPVAAAPAGGRRAWLGTWVRTLLGLALAFGLSTWPWTHICGLRLYWYLAAIGLLTLTALWVMLVSWRRRSGLSHILGLLMLGYAIWLGTSEILPRVGYAKVVAAWSCPAQ